MTAFPLLLTLLTSSRSTVSVHADQWTMSSDGSTTILASVTDRGTALKWVKTASMSSKGVRVLLGQQLRDFISLRGSDQVVAATDRGVWLVSPGKEAPRLLTKVILDRLCEVKQGASIEPTVIGLANYNCFVIDIKSKSEKVSTVTSDQTTPFDKTSPMLALPSGEVLFPNQGLEYVPSKHMLRPASPSLAAQGIYDQYTNVNGRGWAVYFSARIDPTENTHFAWTGTDCFLAKPNSQGKLKKLAFPSSVRVASAFLTDKGELWYEPATNVTSGIKRLRRLDLRSF